MALATAAFHMSLYDGRVCACKEFKCVKSSTIQAVIPEIFHILEAGKSEYIQHYFIATSNRNQA